MKKIFFVVLLAFFNIYSFANTFKDRQEALNEIRKLIDFEEQLAKNFEDNLINMDISDTIIGTSFPLDNSAKKTGNITLSKNNLQISFNLKDDYSSIKELKEFYSSSKYRDRTFVVDNGVDKRIYIKLKDDFAKHIFDLFKYKNTKQIINCIKNSTNSVVPLCKDNNQIYLNYQQTDNNYIIDFDFVYHINNFKYGPIVFQIEEKNISNHTDVLNLFSNGAIFYFGTTLKNTAKKYIKINSDLKGVQ